MNDNTLSYKGYIGSIEISIDDNCLFGTIKFVNDLIAYSGDTPSEIGKAFRDAVDGYLAACAESGMEPEKPFSGTFNVRIAPELHKAAAKQAALNGESLNEFVAEAIECIVDGSYPVVLNETHHHHHTHNHQVEFVAIESSTEDQEQAWPQLRSDQKSKVLLQ